MDHCVERELWKALEYLKERVRVLKEQQEKDKCILLSDPQRIRLTAKNILMENGLDPEPSLTRKTTWRECIKSHWEALAACDFFSVELLKSYHRKAA
ncbi:MAG: hypothetical protein KBE65_14105 [Phycisphaerae bacterium]|nr:hypothetical protein [Phycisphaerae bacterium]